MSLRLARRSVASLGRTPRSVAAPLFCAGMVHPFIADTGGFSTTAGATAHTKGSWVQLTASLSSQASLIGVMVSGVYTAATDTSTLVDIGIGASGSETVIVPNLAVGGYGGAPPLIWVPVRIPSGSRIAARCQSIVAGKTSVSVRIWAFTNAEPSRVPTAVEAIGSNTSTSAGVAMSGSSGTWVEITSATASDYQALTVVPSCSATAGNNGPWRLSLGVGAAGSEVELSSSFVEQTGNPLIQQTGSFTIGNMLSGISIPAGSRLAVKHNISTNPGRISAMILGVPNV